MRTDYMWVDISDWEVGRMHEELRTLKSEGWEVDGIVDNQQPATAGGGGRSDLVSLRLKRQREY